MDLFILLYRHQQMHLPATGDSAARMLGAKKSNAGRTLLILSKASSRELISAPLMASASAHGHNKGIAESTHKNQLQIVPIDFVHYSV
jgi:hypothetical protein